MPESELALSQKQLDTVLAYLPLFEHDDFEFGHWISGGTAIPHYQFSPEAHEFIDMLYAQSILLAGDWLSWSPAAERFINNPSLLQEADLAAVRRLLTVAVRGERMHEGQLGRVYDSGCLLAALQRLKAIRDEHYGV